MADIYCDGERAEFPEKEFLHYKDGTIFEPKVHVANEQSLHFADGGTPITWLELYMSCKESGIKLEHELIPCDGEQDVFPEKEFLHYKDGTIFEPKVHVANEQSLHFADGGTPITWFELCTSCIKSGIRLPETALEKLEGQLAPFFKNPWATITDQANSDFYNNPWAAITGQATSTDQANSDFYNNPWAAITGQAAITDKGRDSSLFGVNLFDNIVKHGTSRADQFQNNSTEDRDWMRIKNNSISEKPPVRISPRVSSPEIPGAVHPLEKLPRYSDKNERDN